MAGSAGQLTLSIIPENDPTAMETVRSNDVYHGTDRQFFAVTFNGAADVNNIHFYIGDASTGQITEAGVETISMRATGRERGQFLLGNNSAQGGSRPFRGLLDALKVYGSKTGPHAALSAEKLREIFHADREGKR
ncbi:MAG: hypothetical protein LBK99_19165 [Opitutaceae bacterium]|jgi:hypothetical protein|nr:hypothetical protein [Opitutaceae bacterium]